MRTTYNIKQSLIRKLALCFYGLFIIISPVNAQTIAKIEFKNQPITDILLVLAQASGTSIIADETVTGSASFFFTEMDIRTALRSFLGSQRLYMREEGGIIYVSRINVSVDTEGLVAIHAEDVDPSLVFKSISRIANKTILYDSLPRSTVTIHTEKATIEEVIGIILARYPEYELIPSPLSLYIKKIGSESKRPGPTASSGKGILRESDGTFTIDFDQSGFLEALDSIMRLEGREYVLMLKGDFSIGRMHHVNKSFHEALSLLMEQAGADYVERNDILYVFEIQKRDILKKLRDTTIRKIDYMPVQDLVTMLPQELSNSSFFKVDKATNSLILSGSEQELAPLVEFIEKVDKPNDGKEYKLFMLKYLKAKEFLALVPSRLFPISPIINSDEYSFVAIASPESTVEIERLILLVDRKVAAIPVRLKYTKTDEFLKLLPPSVSKDDVVDSGFPGLVFFIGSEERYRRFLIELSVIDKPKPQIQYDILVLENSSDYSMNVSASIDSTITTDEDAFAILGDFSSLLSLSFDVVSEFGHTFATMLSAELTKKTTYVYTDTTLTGIVGQEVKFQNTSTYRYKDYEYDSDEETKSAVTRELTSGLILSINGWASSDGMITMTVSATISEQGETSDTSANPPTTTERVVSTQLRTSSGEPVSLTGLIQRHRELRLTKIPLLGDIPLIGRFFAFPSDKDTQSEFSVYIVPRLMTSSFRDETAGADIGTRMSELYMAVGQRP